MKAKEKDRIKDAIRHIMIEVEPYPEVVMIAVEAMEKQIPKKIRIEREHPVYKYASFCPNCNRMDVGEWSYCPDCGQKLYLEVNDGNGRSN